MSVIKQFDKQFNEEAIRLVLEQGSPAAAVAKELGIHVHTLYKWTGQYNKHKENAFPGSGHLRPEDAEIMRLKNRSYAVAVK